MTNQDDPRLPTADSRPPGRWYVVLRALAILWALAYGWFAVSFTREYPPLDPSPWVRGGVYAYMVAIGLAPLVIVSGVRWWRRR